MKSIKLYSFDEVTSTNDVVKELYKGEEIAVTALSQTNGRGRLNRKFISPKGEGLYLSVLIKPNLPVNKCHLITTGVAVITAEVIESLTGVKPKIKWVNDLYLGGKKIAGILTEGRQGVGDKLEYAVVGIGINLLKREFGEELKDIATDVETQTGVRLDAHELAKILAEKIANANFESEEFFSRYRDNLLTLNREVRVITGEEEYIAFAVDLQSDFGLVVESKGERKVVYVGDVSVKL